MTTEVAAPAGETAAANGHADTHSTAGFAALTVGSIGVVYGDIGTSPLYALREAVNAAAAGGEVASHAVLGVISLILWALIIVDLTIIQTIPAHAGSCRVRGSKGRSPSATLKRLS